MAGRPIPYIFCRYEIFVGDEKLDASGQFQLLTNLQGEYFASTEKEDRERRLENTIMVPRKREGADTTIISWCVGRKIGHRAAYQYDAARDHLHLDVVDDPSVKFSEFIALPTLNVFAVDDRGGESHIGGRSAVNRFNNILVRSGKARIFTDWTVRKQDTERALTTWSVTEFSFKARPYNPHPPSDLSKALSEQFEADGIGQYLGRAKPMPGSTMQMSDHGVIRPVVDLAEAGYAQIGVKGTTPEGYDAQIKRPQFFLEKDKNLKKQQQERELRVSVEEAELSDDERVATMGEILRTFYGE